MKRWLWAAAALLVLLALSAAAWHMLGGGEEVPELSSAAHPGVWYRVEPQEAISADGSRWYGNIRIGTENRLMVYFCGGGLSLDAYSAARPYSVSGSAAFYYDAPVNVLAGLREKGICADAEKNPFRDWTMIVVPYSTGDFHVGDGVYQYTDLSGRQAELHHNGYRNYCLLMDAVAEYAGTPEAILVCGSSAGGFAAAMLAEDVISRFPGTENITVCTDAALLMDDWKLIAGENWHAPDRIRERMRTENRTLDHLCALDAAAGGRAKILFACSTRDGTLAKFQSYMDGGEYAPGEAAADVHQANLTQTVRALKEQLPGAGVFIWDGIPYSDALDSTLTRHTILTTNFMYDSPAGGKSIAEWIAGAVEGRVESFGLELLGLQ